MQLFEQREPFNYVSTLPLEECKARLQSLKWDSRWIRQHPMVTLINSNVHEISIGSVKAHITLKIGADDKTKISGEFWFQSTLFIISCVFIAVITLMVLIAGNIIGVIAVIVIGFFIAGAYFEQYEQMKTRLNDLLVESLQLTYPQA